MKKIGGIFIILVFLGLLATGGGFFWWKTNSAPVSTQESKVRVVVPKGSSAERVGNILYEEGVIRSPLAFKMYVQVLGRQNSINAGEFTLSPTMTISKILSTMEKGPEELWVTIPEGLRREEIVEVVIEDLGKTGQEALTFRNEFMSLTTDMEGYLFPDTYLFPEEATAQRVVSTMRNIFDTRFDSEMRQDATAQGLTVDEVVILASIIEKETKTDAERPIVAGIYFNRINSGQGLYVDATIQYEMANRRCNVGTECEWWQPPTSAQLDIDTPYNTYIYRGLPPTPISNPGVSALNAVVYSEDTPYFYYLHEPNGTIHYGITLDDHNANIARYLR